MAWIEPLPPRVVACNQREPPAPVPLWNELSVAPFARIAPSMETICPVRWSAPPPPKSPALAPPSRGRVTLPNTGAIGPRWEPMPMCEPALADGMEAPP